MQRELDKLVHQWNYAPHRKDKKKLKNSSVPRIMRWRHPDHYESRQCARVVTDPAVIRELRDKFAPVDHENLALVQNDVSVELEQAVEEEMVDLNSLEFFSDDFWLCFDAVRVNMQKRLEVIAGNTA